MTTPTLASIVQEVRLLASERARHRGPLAAPKPSARRSLAASILARRTAVIAEMKRASPSAGAIRPDLDPTMLAQAYERAGAAGISVLTCPAFFRGSLTDLRDARASVRVPVLCKDFLVTEFQVLEAADSGADVILLIASALEIRELRTLYDLAMRLNLEVLIEVHDEMELHSACELKPHLLGVNSRDLRTMQVNLERALSLGPLIPESVIGVFESGIKSAEDLQRARDHGFRAALIGESLLRAPDPGLALEGLLHGTASP